MTKKEIYDIESKNFDKIILYREGSFWIAYEKSAYWLYHNVKKYKPNKKYIQTVGEDVIALGFPNKGPNPVAGMKVVEREERRVVVEANVGGVGRGEFEKKFKAWKDGVDVHAPAKPRSSGKGYADNLPVYKEVYDLTLQVYKSAQHMQRDYRYTLGEKIKSELVEMTTAVYSANVSANKAPYIEEARRLIQVVRVQMRLLHDLGQGSVNNMAQMNLSIENIAKQLAAWKGAVERKKPVEEETMIEQQKP